MRRTVLSATVLVAAGALALPSAAAPPKPITKTYTVTAAPSGIGLAIYCNGFPTPTDKHSEPFKAPAKGTLKVKISGHVGDWDGLLLDAAGERIAEAATMGAGDEAYTYKFKKAADVTLMTCNVIGGPTTTVTYTFTFS
ncbi:MAG TPA: hypothetical protein VNA12_05405 [Mycobacteriales bacterium]|nr:hypothetical protein [Mycobacteriales bacterium]